MSLPFELNGSLPKLLNVVEDLSSGETKFYFIVADYGWAEKILCSDMYLKDANEIAIVLARYMNIPVKIGESCENTNYIRPFSTLCCSILHLFRRKPNR